MITIIGISAILITISAGLGYITYKFANTEEAQVINEIQVKYPSKANYY